MLHYWKLSATRSSKATEPPWGALFGRFRSAPEWPFPTLLPADVLMEECLHFQQSTCAWVAVDQFAQFRPRIPFQRIRRMQATFPQIKYRIAAPCSRRLKQQPQAVLDQRVQGTALNLGLALGARKQFVVNIEGYFHAPVDHAALVWPPSGYIKLK